MSTAATWAANTTHGHTLNGRSSPTYRSWAHAKQRCTNPKDDRWAEYGGRGIKFCPRWNSFVWFLADMGVRPEGTSLDRVDVDGNYEPGNCRWATMAEQLAGRRPKYHLSDEQIAALEAAGLPVAS